MSRAYLFIGYIQENQNLYISLQSLGFIIVFKPTLKLSDGKVKGNVDAELVLHSIIEYPNYDRAVIVTGDGDFRCLVEYLEKQRKLERLLVPNKSKYSSLLREFMFRISFMNDLRGKLGYKKSKKRREALP